MLEDGTMPRLAVCPDADRYQRLVALQLTAVEAEELLQHLEDCPSCAQKVAALPAQDTLLERVQPTSTLSDDMSAKRVNELIERLSRLRPAAPWPAPNAALPLRDTARPLPGETHAGPANQA